MEDIRYNKVKNKSDNKIKFKKFLFYFKKNWIKLLILVILILIIIFPNVLGQLLGSWWNDFATSFLQKLTF